MLTSAFFFCQAEDGIRDLVRSRGLGDVYKRQPVARAAFSVPDEFDLVSVLALGFPGEVDRLPVELSLIHI